MRLTFLAITLFWLTMNVLLWRAEYGSHGGETPVPAGLVWRKILTASDVSSLSIFHNRERRGYCEFSTSIGQQMAALDDDKLPPAGLVANAGYQVQLAGKIAMGNFTNQVKFDGRVAFKNNREWKEFHFRISTPAIAVECYSQASNQLVHVKIRNDGETSEHDFSNADLHHPEVILRAFAGNVADSLSGMIELPGLPAAVAPSAVVWDARRTRIKIGTELAPIYRLTTSLLGNEVTLDVSTLGDILRLKLPGGFSARVDNLGQP